MWASTLTNLHFGFQIHKTGLMIILPLWWLMLCVNVTGLRDAQIAGKHYFWVCWRDYFQKTLAFESGNWIKQMALPTGGRLSSGPLRAWTEQTVEEWWVLSLSAISPVLPHGTMQPLFLGPSVSNPNPTLLLAPHFLGLQTELFHWFSWLSSLQTTFLSLLTLHN